MNTYSNRLILFFFILSYCSCAGNGSSPEARSRPIDDPITNNSIAILSPDTTQSEEFTAMKAPLNAHELFLVDSLMQSSVAIYNSELIAKSLGSDTLDLRRYIRQYVPYVGNDSRKKVRILCSYSEFVKSEDWKHRLINVDGGGKYYFRLTVDLERLNTTVVEINSPL